MADGLRDQIEDMFKEDLEARKRLWALVQAKGPEAPEYKAEAERSKEVFSANAERLTALVDAHGWPSEKDVGEKASEAAFLMLQHSDIAIQKKYLPVLRRATEEGALKPSLLPMLEDRVLMADGQAQIYGTQLHHDENGQPALWPIADLDHVDERRAAVGLMPLAEYLARAKMSHLDPRKGGAEGFDA